ncbi:MAG: GNAT family N-acetyltransferase [Promethearchaeota archaeon]|jgi:RimJ/RimL family protein N-acetyltransferase
MLEGENINLRVREKEDLPLFHEWVNDLEFLGEYAPIVQLSKTYVEKTVNESSNDNKMFLIEKKDGKKIGMIHYFMVRGGGPYNLLEIGYTVIPSERKKGYCTEAVKIIVDFIFLSKEVERIQANTDTENIASQKVLEKAGFTKEGIVRKMLFTRGKWADSSLYSILREEWKEPKIL